MKYASSAALSLIIAILLVWVPLASAHVLITPGSAQTAQEVLFSISVPNERQSVMSSLKLNIPSGVRDVSPTIAAGWVINTEKSGDTVTSISWSGGQIPSGQRQDFTFKAQTPEKAGQLVWKAYQTYGDGTVVSWDKKLAADASDDDSTVSGPYSVTDISTTAPVAGRGGGSGNSTITSAALGISLLALILSLIGLVRRPSRR